MDLMDLMGGRICAHNPSLSASIQKNKLNKMRASKVAGGAQMHLLGKFTGKFTGFLRSWNGS